MKRIEWAVLGCRLMAVYLGIFAVLRLASIREIVGYLHDMYQGLPITWSLVSFVGPIVGRLLAAILLWVFSAKLAAAVFRRQDATDQSPGIDAVSVAAVALFLVGIHILATRLPAMLVYLDYFQPGSRLSYQTGGLTDLLDTFTRKTRPIPWQAILADFVSFAIAFGLMLGGTRLSRLALTPGSRRSSTVSDEEES